VNGADEQREAESDRAAEHRDGESPDDAASALGP
jgi:hypothetical protein